MVIPAMDLIDEVLTDASINEEIYAPSIRAACALGKKTLNRYYNKTDDSEMYRITMSEFHLCSCSIHLQLAHLVALVLHPEFKLEYFKNAKWQPAWIKTAEELFRAEYERTYAQYDVAAAEAEGGTETADKPSVRTYFIFYSQSLMSLLDKQEHVR